MIGCLWRVPVFPIAATALLSLIPFLCHADTVHLSDGRTVEGKVVEQSDEEVKVLLPGGFTMGIPGEQVDRVEIEEVPEPTATPMPIRIMPRPERRPVAGENPPEDVESEPEASEKEGSAQPVDLSSIFQDSGDSGEAGSLAERAEVSVLGDRIGVCQKIDGQVEVMEKDGTWRELKTGEVIYKGQRFRSRAGRARLLLDNGTELGITENSEGRIRNEPGSRFQLYRGRIWSEIKGVSRADEVKLEIQSPNAVAAVRGGLLRFEVLPQRGSRITLFEGAAAVEDRGRMPAQLVPLQMAVLDAEGRITGFEEAAEEERREWDFWDQWAADIERDTRHLGFGVGGNIIAGQARQIAAEHQLYESMMDERNRIVMINREAEKLDSYAEGVRRYYRDVGDFPPEDKAWQHLKYNIAGPDWNGPYIDQKIMLPVKDRWGNEIHYLLKTGRTGNRYVELISNGPNGIFEEGEPDVDIKVIVTVPRP
jgi:hypothetical protein